jgi:hypothetical protein
MNGASPFPRYRREVKETDGEILESFLHARIGPFRQPLKEKVERLDPDTRYVQHVQDALEGRCIAPLMLNVPEIARQSPDDEGVYGSGATRIAHDPCAAGWTFLP